MLHAYNAYNILTFLPLYLYFMAIYSVYNIILNINILYIICVPCSIGDTGYAMASPAGLRSQLVFYFLVRSL